MIPGLLTRTDTPPAPGVAGAGGASRGAPQEKAFDAALLTAEAAGAGTAAPRADARDDVSPAPPDSAAATDVASGEGTESPDDAPLQISAEAEGPPASASEGQEPAAAAETRSEAAAGDADPRSGARGAEAAGGGQSPAGAATVPSPGGDIPSCEGAPGREAAGRSAADRGAVDPDGTARTAGQAGGPDHARAMRASPGQHAATGDGEITERVTGEPRRQPAGTSRGAERDSPDRFAARTAAAGRVPGEAQRQAPDARTAADESSMAPGGGSAGPHGAGAAAREGGAAPAGGGGTHDGELPRDGRPQQQPPDAAGAARAESTLLSARALQSALAFLHGTDPAMPSAAPAPTGSAASSILARQESAENISRLVQSMRVLVRNGIGEATVRLRPEHLGEVSIAVRVDGRSVVATVRAEAPGVREWLQSQEDALRAGLAQQGLSLDRLVVHRDPRRDRQDQPPPEWRRPRARHHGDGPERFEISV